MSKTNDQFSLLRDEIYSIKRRSKVYHEHTDRHIKDVDQSTKQLKTAFKKTNDIHLRKLQAISDAEEMMNQKNSRSNETICHKRELST